MEIKPTGPGGPLPPVSNKDQSVKKFAQTDGPKAASGTQAAPAFRTITADYHKADLQDAAKMDQMLSGCSGELLQSALERTGGTVSSADSANLTGFLKSDPVIRGKLLNYLERVLP
jgi:hypothetical protein